MIWINKRDSVQPSGSKVGTTTLNTNQSSIYNSWNANYSGGGPQYTVTPIGYNSNISPGGSQTVGFCANKQGSNWQPAVTGAQ
jgi:cellulase/cellobiase CelA1